MANKSHGIGSVRIGILADTDTSIFSGFGGISDTGIEIGTTVIDRVPLTIQELQAFLNMVFLLSEAQKKLDQLT